MHRSRLIQITALILSLSAISVTAGDWTNKIPDSARIALEKPEQFELLSLDPNRYPNHRPKEEFHGWRILGSMTVKDAESQNELVTALKKCVEENKGMAKSCFNPRHGIRVTRDGKTNDLAICFECARVLAFERGKDEKPDLFFVTGSAQPLFNRTLMKRNIPLAGR
jgi:hypothetical protein